MEERKMDEYDDRGLQDALHRALIVVAAGIDGVSPLEIARVAADGLAASADVETFLSSERLTARLRAAWDDRCPSPSLLARSIAQPGDTIERRELAEATGELVALHASDCPRCTALLAVLTSRSGTGSPLAASLGRPGQDWLGPVRPLSGELSDGVDVTVLDDRLLVRADASLAGAAVYLTVACAAPEVQHTMLRSKGGRAFADLPLPAEPGSLYVDIAVRRRWVAQPVERVELPGGLAAAGASITTVGRRLLDVVLLTAADGRTARLRVKTGTGHSGSAIEVRVLDEPPGGLWTADGRRLPEGDNVVIESGSRPVSDALAELTLGAVGEVNCVH
jgi:hypothetical protein